MEFPHKRLDQCFTTRQLFENTVLPIEIIGFFGLVGPPVHLFRNDVVGILFVGRTDHLFEQIGTQQVVGVHTIKPFAASLSNSVIAGVQRASVRLGKDTDARILGSICLQLGQRSVGRAIVDAYQLPVPERLLHYRKDCVIEEGLGVIHGHNDRYFRHNLLF